MDDFEKIEDYLLNISQINAIHLIPDLQKGYFRGMKISAEIMEQLLKKCCKELYLDYELYNNKEEILNDCMNRLEHKDELILHDISKLYDTEKKSNIFVNANGAKYDVYMSNEKDLLLKNQKTGEYVVAINVDKESNTWHHGTYFGSTAEDLALASITFAERCERSEYFGASVIGQLKYEEIFDGIMSHEYDKWNSLSEEQRHSLYSYYADNDNYSGLINPELIEDFEHELEILKERNMDIEKYIKDTKYTDKMTTFTKGYIVRGTFDGERWHRNRESFLDSVEYNFTDDHFGVRYIKVLNSDITGTNDYSIVIITRDTEKLCDKEMEGQLSDGIFENCNVWEPEPLSPEKTTQYIELFENYMVNKFGEEKRSDVKENIDGKDKKMNKTIISARLVWKGELQSKDTVKGNGVKYLEALANSFDKSGSKSFKLIAWEEQAEELNKVNKNDDISVVAYPRYSNYEKNNETKMSEQYVVQAVDRENKLGKELDMLLNDYVNGRISQIYETHENLQDKSNEQVLENVQTQEESKDKSEEMER